MPRIAERIIESVFFLFETYEDAALGINPGGTGFIVSVGKNLWTGGGGHYFGITNWHVAVESRCSIVRLAAGRKEPKIFDFKPTDWIHQDGGLDVAVVPLPLKQFNPFSQPSISIGEFAFKNDHSAFGGRDNIGVGEDVFMLGLFIDHVGHTTGIPSARFGHLSMLADENALIRQPTGHRGESHIIDMHSRSGFSGSPVFVYRTFASDLTTDKHRLDALIVSDDERGVQIEAKNLFRFLGIHWGQFPERWELRERQTLSENRAKQLVFGDSYVEGMSGMTCVIPSWRVAEVLDLPAAREARQKD